MKQFVHGGSGISVAGAVRRDVPDSVVLHLADGSVEAITDAPGYDETTIFSPDERLGITMTTRFSKADPAILGLVPRPFPDSLNMGLSMFAYTYAVTGVRLARQGNVGPALIDVAASKNQPGYLESTSTRMTTGCSDRQCRGIRPGARRCGSRACAERAPFAQEMAPSASASWNCPNTSRARQ